MILSHDERIVEMRFDNDNFERNVRTTLGTLDTLKAKLGLLDTTTLGLDIDTRAANNVDHITSSVDKLSDRFSSIGIIGKRALENLTDSAIEAAKAFSSQTFGQIKMGGEKRALNIEQAKYLMKGMGVDWKKAYEDIDHAVSGTAYGLDSAAMAAAELSASGVQLGDDMKKALGGISGLAAMTGQDFEQIADVFVAVASSGKVMAGELNRIRGVNVRSLLAKELGMDEGEMRDLMARNKLSIDPQTFFNVIYDQFFETAKEANTTFEGARKNLNSALSRIGELYYTGIHNEEKGLDFAGYLESQRRIFNALRLAANEVKKFVEESVILQRVLTSMENKADFIERLFNPEWSNDDPWQGLGTHAIHEFAGAINVLAKNVFRITDRIGEAWNKIFPSSMADRLWGLMSNLEHFTATFRVSDETLEKIGQRAESIFSILKAGIKVLGRAFDVVKPFGKAALSTIGLVIDFFGYIAQLFLGMRDLTDEVVGTGEGFDWIAERIKSAGEALGDWIEQVKVAVKEGDAFAILAANIIGAFRWMAEAINAGIKKLKEWASESGLLLDPRDISIESVADVIKRLIDALFDIIGHGANRLAGLFQPITDALVNAAKGLFKDANPDNLIAIATGGGIGYLAYRIGQVIVQLKSWAGFLPPAINSLLFSIGRSMRYRAYAMMAIVSVASILAAVIALGSMDQAGLDRGIDAVMKLAAMAAVIVGVFKILSMIMAWKEMTVNEGKKLGDPDRTVSTDKMMFGIAATFAGLAVAVGIMARAMKTISGMTPGELTKGVIGTLALIAAAAGSIILISKFGENLGDTWKSILALAAVFLALSNVISSILKLAESEYLLDTWPLLLIFMSIFTVAAGMMMLAKDADWKPIAALAFTFMALGKVVKSVSKLAKIPENDLAKAMGALTLMYGMLVFLGAMAARAGNVSKAFAGVGIAFALLALSIDILIPAIAALAYIPVLKLAKSLIAIGVIMRLFFRTLSVAAKPSSLLAGAGAMMMMALTIDLLTIPLLSLSAIPWPQLWKAVAAIIILTGVLAALANRLSVHAPGALAGAGAIVIMGIAMMTFLPTVLAFAALPADKLWKAVGAILALMAVMGVFILAVSAIGSKFPLTVPVLLSVAAVVIAVSFGMIGLAFALNLSAIALGIFSGSLAAMFAVFVQFKDHYETIYKFTALLGLFGTTLLSVGAGLLVFGAGLAVAAIAVMIFAVAIGIMSAAILFGASAFAIIITALQDFCKVADEIQNHIQTLKDLAVALVLFGGAMVVLGLGGVVFGAGLVVFALGALSAAAGIYAVGASLEVFGQGFYKLVGYVGGAVQIMINLLASLIDYAFGTAEALAILTGQISDEDIKKLNATRNELKESLKQSGINDIESSIAKSLQQGGNYQLTKAGEALGTTVSNGFSNKAGKFDQKTVQNDLETGLSAIDVVSSVKGLGDKIPSGLIGAIKNQDPSALADVMKGYIGDSFGGIDITDPMSVLSSNMTGEFMSSLGADMGNIDFTQLLSGTDVNFDEVMSTMGANGGTEFVTSLRDNLIEKTNEIGESTGEYSFNKILDGYYIDLDDGTFGAAEDTLEGFADGMEDSIDIVSNAAGNVSDAAINELSRYEESYAAAQDNMQGYLDCLENDPIIGKINKAMASMYTTSEKSFRKAADSHSPSRKMRRVGEDIIAGYEEGIEESSKKGQGGIGKHFEKIWSNVQKIAEEKRNAEANEFAALKETYGIESTGDEIKDLAQLTSDEQHKYMDEWRKIAMKYHQPSAPLVAIPGAGGGLLTAQNAVKAIKNIRKAAIAANFVDKNTDDPLALATGIINSLRGHQYTEWDYKNYTERDKAILNTGEEVVSAFNESLTTYLDFLAPGFTDMLSFGGDLMNNVEETDAQRAVIKIHDFLQNKWSELKPESDEIKAETIFTPNKVNNSEAVKVFAQELRNGITSGLEGDDTGESVGDILKQKISNVVDGAKTFVGTAINKSLTYYDRLNEEYADVLNTPIETMSEWLKEERETGYSKEMEVYRKRLAEYTDKSKWVKNFGGNIGGIDLNAWRPTTKRWTLYPLPKGKNLPFPSYDIPKMEPGSVDATIGTSIISVMDTFTRTQNDGKTAIQKLGEKVKDAVEGTVVKAIAGENATIEDAADMMQLKFGQLIKNDKMASEAATNMILRHITPDGKDAQVDPIMPNASWISITDESNYEEKYGLNYKMWKALDDWTKTVQYDSETGSKWTKAMMDYDPKLYSSWQKYMNLMDEDDKKGMDPWRRFSNINDLWKVAGKNPDLLASIWRDSTIKSLVMSQEAKNEKMNNSLIKDQNADKSIYVENWDQDELKHKLDNIINYEKMLDKRFEVLFPEVFGGNETDIAYKTFQGAIWAELGWGPEDWISTKNKTKTNSGSLTPFGHFMWDRYKIKDPKEAPDLWLSEMKSLARNVVSMNYGPTISREPLYDETIRGLPASIAAFDNQVDTARRRLQDFAIAFDNLDINQLENRFGAEVVKSVSVSTEPPVIKGELISKSLKPRETTKTRNGKGVQKNSVVDSRLASILLDKDTTLIAKEKAIANASAGGLDRVKEVENAFRTSENLKNSMKRIEEQREAARDAAYADAVAQLRRSNGLFGTALGSINKDKAVYIDGNKLVGAVTAKMDKSLGTNVARRARGS